MGRLYIHLHLRLDFDGKLVSEYTLRPMGMRHGIGESRSMDRFQETFFKRLV